MKTTYQKIVEKEVVDACYKNETERVDYTKTRYCK